MVVRLDLHRGPQESGGAVPAPDDAAPAPVRTVLRIVAVAIGVMFLVGSGVALYQWITWPDVAILADENPETTSFIEAYERRAQDSLPEARWEWVPYEGISPYLKRAVVVAEDIEFFSHAGFSMSEIRAAVKQAWQERRSPRGASTITQQLAKNLWLTPARSFGRKLKEAALASQLERHLSKQRILEIYLNVVEFGPGLYGAEAAAQHYFAKPASALTEDEAVRLAAVLPRPSTWSPFTESNAYLARVDRIGITAWQATFLERHIR